MKKAIYFCIIDRHPENLLDAYDWKVSSEFEGVLSMPRTMTTIAHYESKHNTANGHVVKFMVYKNLNAPTISMIDYDN